MKKTKSLRLQQWSSPENLQSYTCPTVQAYWWRLRKVTMLKYVGYLEIESKISSSLAQVPQVQVLIWQIWTIWNQSFLWRWRESKDRLKVREQRPQAKQNGDGWNVLKRYVCPKVSLVIQEKKSSVTVTHSLWGTTNYRFKSCGFNHLAKVLTTRKSKMDLSICNMVACRIRKWRYEGSTSKCNSNSVAAVNPARKNVPNGTLWRLG